MVLFLVLFVMLCGVILTLPPSPLAYKPLYMKFHNGWERQPETTWDDPREFASIGERHGWMRRDYMK